MNIMSYLQIAGQSAYLDSRVATIDSLPALERWRFLSSKWRALNAILTGRPGSLCVGAAEVLVENISDLGTSQSCVVDFYDEVMAAGLIESTANVVDVGANIGQWTAALKWFLPLATVVAIEPEPHSFYRLSQHVSTLPGVSCLHTAAGATVGVASLYRQALSVMATMSPSADDQIDDPIAIPVTTLDDILSTKGDVDLLKIDVEGSELEVLVGAEQTLSRVHFLQAELSLGRGVSNGIDFLAVLKRMRPDARIIKFGRPLGGRIRPSCQDVVLEINRE